MTLKKATRLMPIDPPSSSGSARATARSMAAQADDGTSFRTS